MALIKLMKDKDHLVSQVVLLVHLSFNGVLNVVSGNHAQNVSTHMCLQHQVRLLVWLAIGIWLIVIGVAVLSTVLSMITND